MRLPTLTPSRDLAQTPTSTGNNPFHGRRVLVVEDEPIISMLLDDMLAGLGCEVIGPVAHIAEALNVIKATSGIDAAVLDLNLYGKRSDAIADALSERGIPFMYSTGYGANGLREAHRDKPMLQKPFSIDELSATLARVLSVSTQALS